MVCVAENQIISPEAAEFIATKQYDREGARKLAALLPEDDEQLHQWLTAAGEATDEAAFQMLWSAAAISGRKLRVSLIQPALALRVSAWNLVWVAWRMEGNVTEALLAALEAVIIAKAETRALALFVAAAWWMKHRAGEEPPRQIMYLANALLQKKGLDVRTCMILRQLANLLGSDLFARECARAKVPENPARRRKDLEKMYALLEGPYESFVYEKLPFDYSSNRPKRRAVAEIGRNELCPCGSGGKYKKCCQAKDQERLHYSSSVAGLTRDELVPDEGKMVTAAALEAMGPSEIARLQMKQVPEELQERFIITLSVFKQFDRTVAIFRELGVPAHLRDAWSYLFDCVSTSWRPEIARGLMEVFPDAEEVMKVKAHAGIRFLLVSDDPAKAMHELASSAEALLRSGDLEELQKLIWVLFDSPYRGLGILLARGVLPIAPADYVPGLFEGILAARAKLNLPPEDEFSDWMDEQALRKARQHETAAMQEAQDKLAAKLEELRRAKEERARLERELALRVKHERREKEQARASATPHEAAAQERHDLKAKIERLNALVSQRGEEKLALRRELERAGREKEALQSLVDASDSPDRNDDDEDRHFDAAGVQPVRLIEFPKNFAETLAGFPRHVGRAAMIRLGRLASGEPNAFERVKQLKAYPDVLRARVADKHRLLFCLTPDRVRVVDLIRRADLDRRIERLQASGLPPIG